MAKYSAVKNMDLDPGADYLFVAGYPGMSLSIYCGPSVSSADMDAQVITIKHYLFNNPSGVNPSQQSHIARGDGDYEMILVYFVAADTGEYLASYESGYYATGNRDTVDNFTTWHVDRPGEGEGAGSILVIK